jgi:hypothetical protein
MDAALSSEFDHHIRVDRSSTLPAVLARKKGDSAVRDTWFVVETDSPLAVDPDHFAGERLVGPSREGLGP